MSERHEERRPVNMLLIAASASMLLVLPFVTTFNEVMTRGVMRLGWTGPLELVVPAEARMVVAVLNAIGVHAVASGANLFVWHAGLVQPVYISWNCVGWQSLILLVISLATGLRREHGLEARSQVVVVGVLGTILLSLLRVAAVCYLAAVAGQGPAVLFHDYGGTIITVVWLFAFWAFAYRWILVEPASQELEAA